MVRAPYLWRTSPEFGAILNPFAFIGECRDQSSTLGQSVMGMIVEQIRVMYSKTMRAEERIMNACLGWVISPQVGTKLSAALLK